MVAVYQLTSGGITRLRSMATRSLSLTATIRHPVQVSDNAGGFTTTYVNVSNVPCGIEPTGSGSAREIFLGQQIQGEVAYNISLPALTDVKPTDIIIIGARTFEVLGRLQPALEILRVAICKEIGNA